MHVFAFSEFGLNVTVLVSADSDENAPMLSDDDIVWPVNMIEQFMMFPNCCLEGFYVKVFLGEIPTFVVSIA